MFDAFTQNRAGAFASFGQNFTPGGLGLGDASSLAAGLRYFGAFGGAGAGGIQTSIYGAPEADAEAQADALGLTGYKRRNFIRKARLAAGIAGPSGESGGAPVFNIQQTFRQLPDPMTWSASIEHELRARF